MSFGPSDIFFLAGTLLSFAGVFLCFGYQARCPRCRRWFAQRAGRRFVQESRSGRREEWALEGLEVVTYEAFHEERGSFQRVARFAPVGYLVETVVDHMAQNCDCRSCGHRWVSQLPERRRELGRRRIC